MDALDIQDGEIVLADIIGQKLALVMIPGMIIECTPIQAEEIGIFIDDAVSDADAFEASTDVVI